MTTGLAIVSSLFFSYIKGYFWIDTGNAEQVNAKVEFNDLILCIFGYKPVLKMNRCVNADMCICLHVHIVKLLSHTSRFFFIK